MNGKNLHLSVIFCLVIFISVGIIASVLTNRLGFKLDITENRLYTLSDETKSLLDTLDERVTLTVFDLETDFPAIVGNLLDSYDSASDNIEILYCDPYHEPQKVRQISERGFNVALSDIAVECDGRTKLLKLSEMYKLDESESFVVSLMAEQQISSAVSAVIKSEKGTVLFTDGHGETPSASLMALFENNSYRTALAELSVTDIPEDTKLVVICAPQKDASKQEIEKLREYTDKGGALMCFMASGSSGFERFGEFLAERGIGLTDETVHEPTLCIAGNELNLAPIYSNHEINSFFASTRRFVISPSTAALEQLYVKQGRTRTQSVLRSSSQSYTELADTGSRELCLSSERTSTDASGRELNQRTVVFGSKLIYGDDLMSEDKLANTDFIMQTVQWLIGDGELINVPVKNLEADILPATGELTRIYVAVFAVALPIVILAAGLTVYIKRRYL